MMTEDRRQVLITGVRYAAAAALGALAVKLGLRRGTEESRSDGYCDRAGRCGGCEITADCDVYQAMNGGGRP